MQSSFHGGYGVVIWISSPVRVDNVVCPYDIERDACGLECAVDDCHLVIQLLFL